MTSRLVKLLLVSWIMIGCAAPPPPPASPPPALLRILNWDTYIDPTSLDAFTGETGIAIVYHTYSNNEELYNLLTTANEPYDLVIVSDILVDRLIREQRLAVLNRGRIPNLANLDPAFNRIASDPVNRFCVPYLWGVLGFGYRQSAQRQPITSWDDVFDPARSNRVVMIDDPRFGLGLALIKLEYSPNTSDPSAIGAARDWLRTHAGRIIRFAGDDGQTFLANGEADVVIEWSGDILQLASIDPDIRFEIPAEGAIFAADNMCVLANAANHAVAEQFINFLLTGEHGAALANKTCYISPNRAAFDRLDNELQHLIQRYQALEQEGRLFRLVDVDSATYELYRAAWAEVRR
ncbi:spermidine/putrescine ABC transporter substrate-binding protein [Chloroflexus sp.]|uniref:polyamine ABC transporter substrate-binding protein n=1 Tax=Chloroflexus sp. TaxID=1904827 RepID=UPI002ACD92E7|nr:spermidine/putrescine ABC transporter substrate-binding protein [Chloroflexus sp.]